MIKLIVAADVNGSIGLYNRLPWYSPTDLKHFKEKTQNAIVVMGRKTWESLNMPNGLPNRLNVVLTAQCQANIENETIKVINTIDWLLSDEAQELQKTKDIWIIGGASLYKQTLDLGIIDEIVYTYVNDAFNANTSFPYPYKLFNIAENGEPKFGKNKFRQTLYEVPKVNEDEPQVFFFTLSRV